jgi:DNA-binding NtrC family response regulator
MVDDSKDIIKQFAALVYLENPYISISTAVSESDAMALLANNRFDLACLDIRLKSGNGLNILKHIKRTDPGMVVMMLTGFSSKWFREECIRLGADYFFNKFDEFKLALHIIQQIAESKKNKL